MTRRYSLRGDGDNRAILSIQGRVIHYWAPTYGGYVRDVSDPRKPGTLGLQVCEKLVNMGSTLYWSGNSPLVNMIRRQVRRKNVIEWLEWLTSHD